MDSKKTTQPKRATVLLRVSTSKQAASGLGVDAQLAAVRQFASQHGIKIQKIVKEEGISGGLPLEKRVGLLEALAAVEKGELLLVAKRDRLSRDPLVSLTIENLLKKRQARVISAAGEGTEDDEPTMILLRRLTDAFAEHEKLLAGSRTKMALAEKKKKGITLGRAPFGFKRRYGKMVQDTEQQAVIARARELKKSGMNFYQIAKTLGAEGIRNTRGGVFQANQVAKWLNPDGKVPNDQ